MWLGPEFILRRATPLEVFFIYWIVALLVKSAETLVIFQLGIRLVCLIYLWFLQNLLLLFHFHFVPEFRLFYFKRVQVEALFHD